MLHIPVGRLDEPSGEVGHDLHNVIGLQDPRLESGSLHRRVMRSSSLIMAALLWIAELAHRAWDYPLRAGELNLMLRLLWADR